MGTRRLLWIPATLLVASALAGVAAPALIRADSTDPRPGTISVTGTGTVTTEPDTATTTFGVVTQGSTAREAMLQNSEEMAKVIEALKRAGIASKDVQTQYVSLDPRYDNQGREVVGYSATNSVSAIVRDLAQAGAVIDAAVAAGANNVSGPSLSRDDQGKLYNDAPERGGAGAKAKGAGRARAAGGSARAGPSGARE